MEWAATVGSDVRQPKVPNVEFYEQNFPILYLYRREQRDSAGAGRWRGGSGGVIACTPHKGELSLATATVYGIPKTHGILGGYPGTKNETKVLRGTGVRKSFADGILPCVALLSVTVSRTDDDTLWEYRL